MSAQSPTIAWQREVGNNHVGAYQVSGEPFASGNIAASNAHKVEFPLVTRWITVINNSSQDVRVGFSENGVSGSNYFTVAKKDATNGGTSSSGRLELKCSEIWLYSPGVSATVDVVGLATSEGKYISEDGHLSETTMKIQDSLYYQDFSYVVKVGRTIDEWRDSFKKTMHPAGFYFTGQVNIESRLDNRIKMPVVGRVTGITASPWITLLNTLFGSVFGRRLGTTSDGTTLNTTPESGFDANTDGGGTVLPSGKREVTLTSSVSVATDATRGKSSTGPFLKNLTLYGFMEDGFLSDDENIDAYYSIDQFATFKINDVDATGGFSDTDEEKFDSTTRSFDEVRNFHTIKSLTTRINVPPRGELRITKTGMFQTFDMDFKTFDDIRQTFDEGSGGGITIDTLGTEFIDFSETTSRFDSTAVKFDVGFAGLTNPLDFSQTLYKFDDTLGGDYARFDADFSVSQTANITTTFDASAFRFDATLSDMGLTFDNTAT